MDVLLATAVVVVACWLCRIAVRDARTGVIPNAAIWPGLVAVCASAAATPSVGVAAGVATVPYLVAFLRSRCGGGDVKLGFVLGGMIGDWAGAVLLVGGAAVLSILTSIGARERRRMRPHAPAMTVSAVAIVGVEQLMLCCAG